MERRNVCLRISLPLTGWTRHLHRQHLPQVELSTLPCIEGALPAPPAVRVSQGQPDETHESLEAGIITDGIKLRFYLQPWNQCGTFFNRLIQPEKRLILTVETNVDVADKHRIDPLLCRTRLQLLNDLLRFSSIAHLRVHVSDFRN